MSDGLVLPSHDRLYYHTRSLCPTCEELVPGAVIARDGGVFVTRSCPQHGPFEGIICSDLDWYENLGTFDVEGIKPAHPRNGVRLGCPEDCGLCEAHSQIAGTAAIEISNECNAACPVCLADNQGTFELGVNDVRDALLGLLRQQDHVDSFTLSGGEPTLHPELFEILELLDRPEVGRIVLNTNGLRIARDDAFLDRLAKQNNVYVCLHYDGPNADRLRGVDHQLQQRALERLSEWGVKAAPLVLAAQGVNDEHLGSIVSGLIKHSPNVRSIVISMMTYAGQGGSCYDGDPLTRLTIPAALDRIETGSGGELKKRDFIPLPMPNPLCAALGYFLVMDGQVTALIPLADVDRVVECTKNASFGTADAELGKLLQDIVDDIFAHPDRYDDAPALLARFKRLISTLFPVDRPLDPEERRQKAEELIKTVYLMQFMDSWSFDSTRLCKCSCQHLLPGGQIIPSCGYYSYHRRFDQRFGSSVSASSTERPA